MCISRFVRDENGATAMEYGLLVSLISVVMMSALFLLGGSLEGNLNSIESQFAKGTGTP